MLLLSMLPSPPLLCVQTVRSDLVTYLFHPELSEIALTYLLPTVVSALPFAFSIFLGDVWSHSQAVSRSQVLISILKHARVAGVFAWAEITSQWPATVRISNFVPM